MSSDYKFVSTDPDALIASLISAYETITSVTVLPASPEHLFILWVADVIIQTRVQINYAANQNIPSRASGKNLDALGELFYERDRPEATASSCTMRFYISAAQTTSILIPSGTRVTDSSRTLVWATTADAYVAIGDTHADVQVLCNTVGAAGNGYVPGQINKLVDVFSYYNRCENITVSDGGADQATDEQYYEIMRASEDAYSTAGPMGGYEYWAKSVSTDIADVKAIMPLDQKTGELMAGHVHIFTLMNDGDMASGTIKEKVLAACNADEVRPLTDFVSAEDPNVVDYNIRFTYYIPTDTKSSAAEIQQAVENTVNEYVSWQSGKLGRDINPTKLYFLLREAGIKRIELNEPAFVVLSDGVDHTTPELARVSSISITNGGYENE